MAYRQKYISRYFPATKRNYRAAAMRGSWGGNMMGGKINFPKYDRMAGDPGTRYNYMGGGYAPRRQYTRGRTARNTTYRTGGRTARKTTYRTGGRTARRDNSIGRDVLADANRMMPGALARLKAPVSDNPQAFRPEAAPKQAAQTVVERPNKRPRNDLSTIFEENDEFLDQGLPAEPQPMPN